MLNADITTGVFDRFRSLPIARWAPLAGAIMGDAIRYVISIAVTLGFGFILGFRIEAVAAVGRDGLPAAARVRARDVLVLRPHRGDGGLAAGGAGRDPADVPDRVRLGPAGADLDHAGLAAGVREGQPGQYLSDAERALLVGGASAAGPVERSLLWALGIFLVFAPLAVGDVPAPDLTPGSRSKIQNRI